MKTLILAAGRGSRLRPLTDHTPKPLLRIGSQYLVENSFKIIRDAGLHEVVINVSYLAQKIMNDLGNGKKYGLKITYSIEEPSALGTGGGILNALPLLGSEPFLIMSGDIWTNFSLSPDWLTPRSTDAHLLLVDNPVYYPQGDYSLRKDGSVFLNGEETLTYAGIAQLHPRLFMDCKAGIFSLAPLFKTAIQKGRVTGDYFSGTWFNVGTEKELCNLRETTS